MKTLLLIRHAKSSWEDIRQSDMDRPLNERGKKDAPEMAKRVREKMPDIQLFVSSPAKRARKTARLFADEYKAKDEVVVNDSLYDTHAEMYFEVVSKLDDKADIVALFGHNPTLTEFANQLTNVKVDDMPTCAVFAVSIDIESWSQFRAGDKKFLFFDYPKNPLS